MHVHQPQRGTMVVRCMIRHGYEMEISCYRSILVSYCLFFGVVLAGVTVRTVLAHIFCLLLLLLLLFIIKTLQLKGA